VKNTIEMLSKSFLAWNLKTLKNNTSHFNNSSTHVNSKDQRIKIEYWLLFENFNN
jgi:hypothetical protein